jgi:hypothetical protein
MRLHDDELSCVFSFLELEDVAQLVRCSRRFNAVARKERSRRLHFKGGANIVPVPSSSLIHHVTSLDLHRIFYRHTPVTLSTLQPLRAFPRLSALQITLSNDDDVVLFMQGLPPETAAATLRAVLPPQLRSFRVVVGLLYSTLQEQTASLASSFWNALGGLLHIVQYSEHTHMRPELDQLLRLRKLTLGPAGERGEHVEALKPLSQLRELTLLDDHPERIRLLCEPPHALQLRSLILRSLDVDEATMRALLHLPTLTTLLPGSLSPDAGVLLPQLPLLRRLRFVSSVLLTPGPVASLCAALSRCSSLEDLSLPHADFASADNSLLTPEEERATWAALLSAVPNLRRLSVHGFLDPFLPVLPQHLPLLKHLVLRGGGLRTVDHIAAVAHPNMRLLELGEINSQLPSSAQLRACIHSDRLPKLKRCIRTYRKYWTKEMELLL